MNRWQRFGQWLVSHWEDIIKRVVPVLTLVAAFVSLKVPILGQPVVFILAFLALNALVERFLSLNKIEKGILSISNTHMPRIENAVESVALTSASLQLGITGITSRWTDFRAFQQPFGESLRQQLENAAAATWYVVTSSPQGLLEWQPYYTNAVEDRKIDIKWVYHPLDVLKTSPAIKAQALMLFGEQPDWQVRDHMVETEWGNAIERLNLMMGGSESRIRLESKSNAGSWELYESTIPHFFMAFLSVPKKQQSISPAASAPAGTFGFVHLYPMFPKNYHERPAIYFEAPGSFTDVYNRSILTMFDENINRGYLQRKHPQDKTAAAQA